MSQQNIAAQADWRQSIANRLGRWRDQRLRRAFGRHLWHQLRDDDSLHQAGVLSYTSLLAIVPLMAVVLGVASAFPVFESLSGNVQDFVFKNFVPAAGEVVQGHLQQFVGNARVLTGPGALFLVITALLLMSNIEKALNRIWRVGQPRPWGSRMLVYWAMLTLGPILLGGSLALTSVVTSWTGQEQYAWLSGVLGWVFRRTPFIVALVGFTLVYLVVPNRRVPLRYALLGGVVAALLFEAAKLGFVWYVSTFPTYEKLYGALAVIPIFLLWIYVTWLVTLFGAGLSAGLSSFRYEPVRDEWDRRFDLIVAFRALAHLWQAQCRGAGLEQSALARLLPAGAAARLLPVLDILIQAGWVRRLDEEELVLAIDTEVVSLGQLYRLAPFSLPLQCAGQPGDDTAGRALGEAVGRLRDATEPVLSGSLKSYFRADTLIKEAAS